MGLGFRGIMRVQGPNNSVLGFKYYTINGIWDLNPIIWVLGPLGKNSRRRPPGSRQGGPSATGQIRI